MYFYAPNKIVYLPENMLTISFNIKYDANTERKFCLSHTTSARIELSAFQGSEIMISCARQKIKK